MAGLVSPYPLPTDPPCHPGQRLRQLHKEGLRAKVEEVCLSAQGGCPSLLSRRQVLMVDTIIGDVRVTK